jgi:hypothetical protein
VYLPPTDLLKSNCPILLMNLNLIFTFVPL